MKSRQGGTAREQSGGGKVGTSSIQRLLRDPYYAGWVVYKRGTDEEQVFPGRHEALVDQETFDQVQAILNQRSLAGERPQKNTHYLKGSLYCPACGLRLTYGISTGSNGTKYPYFFCSGRINSTSCDMRSNFPPELVEAAVQRH